MATYVMLQAGSFIPFGMETTGGWGRKARNLVKTIAASRSGQPISHTYRMITLSLRGAVIRMMAASFGRCTAQSNFEWL